LTGGVKRSIDFAFDDHPDDDEEKARVAWAVAAVDDCDGCGDLRVEVTLEDAGANGTGVTAHFSPDTARRVRVALATALREVGEDPGS
jgi:predicted neutral ceramidase superfamily lipid hydrolase